MLYGDHTVDVSAVRRWVVHYSSGYGGLPSNGENGYKEGMQLVFITAENAQPMVWC